MPTSGTGNWPYPSASVVPDVPADIKALADRAAALVDPLILMALVNVADLNALAAVSATSEGRRIHVDELNCDFQAQDGGWVQVGVARFASTSARDTAYAKASGAFLVTAVQALDTSTGITARYSGTAWVAWLSDWMSWTPTLSAGSGTFAVGNGTLTARYRYADGVVEWKFRLVLGSTSTIGTSSAFTLPVSAEAAIPAYSVVARGTHGMTSGATIVDAVAYRSGTSQTSVVIGVWNVGSTYPILAVVAATVPFTWGNGYYIELDGTYRPA